MKHLAIGVSFGILISLGAVSGTAQETTPERLRVMVGRYQAREPSVADVVSAALAAMSDSPERARRIASRARIAGWIPSLRVGIRRGQGWDLSALQSEGSDRTNISTDDELSVQAWVSFRLDRVVFAQDEVALLREERALSSARRELIRTVVHIYYERQRLMLERDLLGRGDIDHLIRIAEATALLDGFTDGAFRRSMWPRTGGRE